MVEPNGSNFEPGTKPRVPNNTNLSHGHRPSRPFYRHAAISPTHQAYKSHVIIYPVYRSEDRVSDLWYQLITQPCPTHFKFHLCQVSHKQLLIPALRLRLTCFPCFSTTTPKDVFPIPLQSQPCQDRCPEPGPFSQRHQVPMCHGISFHDASFASFPTSQDLLPFLKHRDDASVSHSFTPPPPASTPPTPTSLAG